MKMPVHNEEDERLVWRVLDDEALILDLSTGYYFSLNPVATDIWMRLQDGESIDAVVTGIAEKYAVGTDAVRQDLDELLADLRAAKLWGGENG